MGKRLLFYFSDGYNGCAELSRIPPMNLAGFPGEFIGEQIFGG